MISSMGTLSGTMKLTGKTSQRGFSLMELVIVIIITAVIFSVALTKWPGQSISVDAQLQQLKVDIRYVQNLSMTSGTSFRINFYSQQYTLTQLDGVTTIPHPGTGSGTISLGTGMTLSVSGLPSSYLVFDRRGIPYINTTGTVLSSTATLTLSSTDSSKSITITPQTGKVT